MINIRNGCLFQWDINRQLEIDDEDRKITHIHFAHESDTEAMVVPFTRLSDKLLVTIPNILLQTNEPVMVFAVSDKNGEVKTLEQKVLTVLERQKPSDYIYTETEIITYRQLEERIDILEKMGGAGGSGVSPVITVTPTEEGNEVNITDVNGNKTFEVKDGKSINPKLKLLVLGDSLLGNDQGKAFIGNIGCIVENRAVSGATLAEISERKRIDGTYNTLYDQLVKFRAQVQNEKASGIQSGEGSLAFHEPDVILICGGGNDYLGASLMGTLNAYPAAYSTPTYERYTAMGGLEILLADIAKYYPAAQKFFLIMHKVFEASGFTLLKAKNRYWPGNYCYVRVPYTRNEDGNEVTTWELLFDQNYLEITSTGELTAATALYVRKFTNEQKPGTEYINYVAEPYARENLNNAAGAIDLNKFKAHYTYNELRDNILKACSMYGVKPIDIYNEGCINVLTPNIGTPEATGNYWHLNITADDGRTVNVNSGVKSSKALANTAFRVANVDFFDWKGVHPTALCYEVGYKPFIKEILSTATVR
ncbi:MAG: hypothetical protein E7544_09935 [Ruminococcaceae bacterium]|nr:hypothetical protein [Oscillospiraceae bacterium]